MLASGSDEFHNEELSKRVMDRPLPNYNEDRAGHYAWKWEAEGRLTCANAEAFAKGFKAESDRFEV